MNKKNNSLLLTMMLAFLTGCQTLHQQKLTTPTFQDGLNYTKVSFNNNKLWFVSSFSDNWPKNNTSIWYSNTLNVMRLHNGRMISYTSKKPYIQWHETIKQPIDWKVVLRRNTYPIFKCSNGAHHCKPYMLEVTGNPNISGIDTSQYIWIKETPNFATNTPPISWFGIKKGSMVPSIAKQCMNQKTCIVWQRVK